MESSMLFLVIKILFLISVNGAPLEQNVTTGDREPLSETTQNSLILDNKIKSALMSSIPTLRYVNDDKNFDVKFQQSDFGTTKKIHIINNLNADNVKQTDKTFEIGSSRRNSNVFDSILSKPFGGESNFGEKTSRRVVLKSRRIVPNNQDQSQNQQANIEDSVIKDKLTEFTKNDNNGSSNSRIESNYKVSHEVGHDSDANQGHEESKNKHDSQPNLNVTPIRSSGESVNNDGKYRRPQIAPRIFSTPDRPKDFYKFISESTDLKDDDDKTDKNKISTPPKERTSLRNEIKTLDVYSRLSEIENILTGVNNDETSQSKTEKNDGDKNSSSYVEPFSNNESFNKQTKSTQEVENESNRSTGTKKYTSIQRNPPNRSRSRYNFKENSRGVYETIKNEDDLFNQNYPRETIEKLKSGGNQVDNKSKQDVTIKQDINVDSTYNNTGKINNFSLSPNQSDAKNKLMDDLKNVVNKDSPKLSGIENKIIRNQPNGSQNTLNVRQRTRTNERKTYGDDVLKHNYPRETIVDNLRNNTDRIDNQTTERSKNDSSQLSDREANNKNNEYTTIEWVKVKPTPAATPDSGNIGREKVLLRNGNFNRDGRIDKTDANQNSQIIKVQSINERSQVSTASAIVNDSAQVTSRAKNESQININENISSVVNRGRNYYLNSEVPERGNNLLNTGRNKDFGKTLVDEIIKESDEHDLGLRTEESSYYSDNSKQSNNGYTSRPIIVEVEETTRFKVDNYYSNRHKTIESTKYEKDNENTSRISLDLNERGGRKFLPSRFETISPYVTDSMTKKLYADVGDEIQRSDKIDSRTQTLEENTIENTRYKFVPNANRGSIKYEAPKNYDWYDYNDDLYNSGEVGTAPAQFGFMYQAPNGTDVYQKGTLKKINNKKVFVIHGSYKYISPDGTPISVTYTADENGFHPLETKITDTFYKPKDEIRTNLNNEIKSEDGIFTQEVTTTEESTSFPAGEDRDIQNA